MYEENKKKKTPYEFFSNVLNSISQFVFSTIEAIVVALALSIILYLFVATPHEVVGRSMMPNFESGEYLIGNKIGYRFGDPQRGDVVIFEYNEYTDYIKRILGLPGENVSIQNGKIHINNEQLDETQYLDNHVITHGGDYLQEGTTVSIPSTSYFVAGDNRPNSSDSRDFGPVSKEQIKGKAFFVYFPFTNIRLITHTN